MPFIISLICFSCADVAGKEKQTKHRGDYGLALAQSPGSGNSNSVYIFFLFLCFSVSLGEVVLTLFLLCEEEHLGPSGTAVLETPCLWRPACVQSFQSSVVCLSIWMQRPSGQHLGL